MLYTLDQNPSLKAVKVTVPFFLTMGAELTGG